MGIYQPESTRMMPKVFIIILNWNKPEDTLECLLSCKNINYENYEIIVVDNHSSDDSVSKIKSSFPQIRIIENSENLGYAGGNNVGMRYALEQGADYVLLLNNDVIVDKKVLSELIRIAQSSPQAGMLAPKVLYYDDRDVINSLGTSMDWLRLRPYLGACNQKDAESFNQVEKKDILLGCALLIHKTTIQRIGMLDEKFFIFHEEADWCFRNLKSGFINLVVPSAVIYHKASKTMREFSCLTHYYSIRNFLYLTTRNALWHQWLKTRIGLFYLILKHLRMMFLCGEKEVSMARAFFFGIIDYYLFKMGKCERTF